MQVPSEKLIACCDVVFASAGRDRSEEWGPVALKHGAWYIDNSSAFRMKAEVPLVVAEINIDSIGPDQRLIANPNCTAMILLMAVAPLHRKWPIERVTVSTYQSASGAGAAAMQELIDQTAASLRGEEVKPQIFPHPYAFNLFSHNSPIDEAGSNDEENKVIQECRKILDEPNLKMNVTCVRVPVLRAHSISINLEFQGERPTVEQAQESISRMPGVRLVDDAVANHFPMPIEASGQRDVLVGRIRFDPSHERGMNLFVCGDQLLKGAALNAVQIGLRLLEDGKLSERTKA